MVVLTAKNLGERQRELNKKVIEAASNNVDFDQLRDATEQCDIDRLFKIDVASKYKNVDYIVEVFKSGDPLYISRSLKCDWLFAEEHSNVMNVDYLHQNVFPFMSFKMKKKLLSTMSVHVRNEMRAASFYTYCMDTKLCNTAYKFLLFTSESFKLDFLKRSTCDKHAISNQSADYTKHFIQNSFLLANAYLIRFNASRDEILHELRYLYSVSKIQYLELLETFDKQYDLHVKQFGSRLSKDIVTQHKHRILKNPSLYIKILNKNILVKHSTAEDAKIYLPTLLPEQDFNYWNRDFCDTYKYIIELIPLEDRFEFVKKIFTDKYPKEPFETTLNFYNLQHFKLMTPERRELWALRHVETQSELLGVGNDYVWYKYVNFNKALVEIKKLIMITPDKAKRLSMVMVLIDSAKNQRDLERLFNYFYERHINELTYAKERFLDEVLYKNNPFEFDENCWMSFNKILYSLEVYSVTGYNNSKVEYRTIALIYHIIKKKEVPEALQNYIDSHLNFYVLINIYNRLANEEIEMIYQYLFGFYMDKLKQIYNGDAYDDNVKYQVRKYIYFILDLLDRFDKTRSECPEMLMTLMKLDWEEYSRHLFLCKEKEQSEQITQHTYIRYLKKDAARIIEKNHDLKDKIKNGFGLKLNLFLRKLKVYYTNDLAKKYVDFFNELLSGDKINKQVARTAVYGIFQLADDDLKAEFMQKHAPSEWKIDHININQNLLYIQQAICEFVCISRPPVPLKDLLTYIKGDYVQHCLPMFNSYLAHLPTPLLMKFVESIIDAPLSIQKHGIRLAFVCFNTDNLAQLVTSVWKKTKNVSLRMVIYQALFNKILVDKDNKRPLYKPLKAFTLDIYEDDDNEIFTLLTSDRLPNDILGDYIEAAWTTVAKLPQKTTNLQRLNELLRCVNRNMTLIRKDLIEAIIDEHIKTEFSKQRKGEGGDKIEEKANNEKSQWINAVVETKWDITAKYLTYIESEDELASKLNITKLIMKQYIEKWNEIHDNSYSVRRLCLRFIRYLDTIGYQHDEKCYKYTNVLLQNILKMLQEAFSVEEIYIITWQLYLNMIARKVIVDSDIKMSNVTDENEIIKTAREIGINFANEFGFLLREFIEKDIYYVTFLQEIENILADTTKRVINAFSDRRKNKIDGNDFRVVVCFGLVQLKTPATNLFALKLAPLDYDDCYVEEYKYVLKELKNVDDKEFRCMMRHKFVNSDLIYRKHF